MPHVVQTEALVAEGILTEAQGAEIARRSRDTMLALVVNIVLCAGIIAASLGFVFWIADAAGVALLGLAFLGIGAAVLVKGGPLYRMLGHAGALIGGGMLIAGAGVEIADKYADIAPWTLTVLGAAIAAVFGWLFRKSPEPLAFSTGALMLMGAALHLVGGWLVVDVEIGHGWANVAYSLYATAVLLAAGLFVNVRAVTALAVVPFAQALSTGTAYFHAAYVFYSPEPTLTILQMAAAIGAAAWVVANTSDRIGRHAGIFAIMAAVVGNLAFLVGSLWGDEVGLSFFRDAAPNYSDFTHYSDYNAAMEVWRAEFFQISEHVFSVVWAVLLVAGAWLAAASHRRGLFNTAVTFLGIHAYTQAFETFSDEPMVYALGGLAAIPLAWGLWRLNHRMFGTATPA
ncbi:hypothetical protein GQ651_13500 [Alphaproteobacteria bacterium GH1-50]|uniref:DUF2157 domain-containing protein n=1 Tax=Kangsaoukella pontilimi TaxID=2691042 RepID=A0A7C9IH89_9RHOB|nr:DUF2157 domain-containing protein [Kangsaoukella pontilimi]MXQ08868.1 hypothetical protein [Kangsaoukella pontilimi]